MPARRYVALQTGKSGVLLALESPQSTPGTPGPGPGTPGPGQIVHRFDLKQRRADTPLSGVRFFQMAENGEKMLFSQGQGDALKWLIGTLKPLPPSDAPPPAAPAGGTGGSKTLKTTDLEVRIDPREEWPQMYREVWRIQREMFYDPGLHGLELNGGMKRYERYVAHLSSRADLNYLFQDMMGELSVGHLNAGGGEQPELKTVSTGLLGADFEVADGKYRFKRIFSGENWNPTAQAPLTQPGVNVRVGEYLLAVDGSPVAATDSVYPSSPPPAGGMANASSASSIRRRRAMRNSPPCWRKARRIARAPASR
jgi:tricorn protease